jgi:hypothetical protein
MDLAFKVIKDRKHANPITSVFLLTDGLDGGAAQRVQSNMTNSKLNSESFGISSFGFGRDHDEKLLT